MRRYNDKIFDIVNTVIMVILIVIFAWPLWFVVIASISDPTLVQAGQVLMLPKGLNFEGYRRIMEYKQIWVGYANSLFYTVVGTMLNMVISVCMAYPMSVKSFALRKPLMIFFMISMYFSGGLIPTYLLVRNLGLINTRWAILVVGMISIYNSLIIRNFFMNSIPEELREAAKLDGANSAQYLIKVVLPLSKAVFAVVGLYYLVSNWNDFTKALYYIYDDTMLPLQSVLRRLLISSKLVEDLVADPEMVEELLKQAETMKYGIIIVAAVPMLCVYPFIQKYFVKGVMVGSIKG